MCMQVAIRKIGNSKGVIIPASFLEQLDFGDAVEMKLENNQLILKSIPQLRKNWFDNYDPTKDVFPLDDLKETQIEQEDWEW